MRKACVLARLLRHAAHIIAGDLAGGEHVIAEREGLVVMRKRARRRRLDDLMLETLTRHISDEIDLDQRVLHQKAGAADGGARRRHLEIAFPYRIEAVKIVEIGEEDLRLDHMFER